MTATNRLFAAILMGVVAAIATVVVFGEHAAVVYPVGQLFLRVLRMLIIPLIVFSVLAGITELGDVRRLGRLGGYTAIYYAATMLVAALLGLILAVVIEPGGDVNATGLGLESAAEDVGDRSVVEVALDFVGTNIVGSMAEMEIPPVIIFCILFGATLTTIGERGQPLVDVIVAGNEVMMKMVRFIMWAAPVGIFGLVAGRFGTAMAEGGSSAFYDQIGAVAVYMTTVVVGLALHAIIVLPLALYLFGRTRPLQLARSMRTALITAFSTASSSATLPATLEGVDGAKVTPRVARFVVPVGATINMDGSALYEAVAVVFIAQVAGVELSSTQIVLIILVATVAAIGAAGIPEAGLVTMVVVLETVGLPITGIELLLPVDWILDRLRTAVNVWGDSVGAAILDEQINGGQGPSAMAP